MEFNRSDSVIAFGLQNQVELNGIWLSVLGKDGCKIILWNKQEKKAYKFDCNKLYKKIKLSKKPQVFTIDNFLSLEECSKLINLFKSKPKNFHPSDHCTSSQCVLKFTEAPNIASRTCLAVGFEQCFAEGHPSIRCSRYGVGQEFKLHHDAFEEATLSIERQNVDDIVRAHGRWVLGAEGQRLWTALLFLDDEMEGGETNFPKLDVKVKPKAGTLLAWNNCGKDDAVLNVSSYHQGLPIIEGEKHIAVIWFREFSNQGKPYFG